MEPLNLEALAARLDKGILRSFRLPGDPASYMLDSYFLQWSPNKPDGSPVEPTLKVHLARTGPASDSLPASPDNSDQRLRQAAANSVFMCANEFVTKATLITEIPELEKL
jgi:hypothetical protein